MRLLSKKRLMQVSGGFAASFLIFFSFVMYPQQAHADACAVNGLNCYIGYFFGQYDGGPGKRQHNVLAAPALLNVNDPNTLAIVVGDDMHCQNGVIPNPGSQNATGAAFIVLTMMGYPPGTPKNKACEVYRDWANLLIAWAPHTNYNVFYNFHGLNTRSSINDVAYYTSAQSEAWSIVFYSPVNGEPLYAIKKDCANPVGRLQALQQQRPYTLTPHVDSVSPTEIEAGSKVSVTSSVNNVGEVPSNNTQWEITQITVKPGKKAPHEDEGPTNSGQAPCQSGGGAPVGNYFQSPDATCKNVAKGAGVFNVGSPAQNLKPGVGGLDIGDVPVGTHICFALSVQPRSYNDASWAHSQPICIVVGKKPKIQVWGGDVSARGNIETSTSVKDMSGTTRTFGSWVEYGTFSAGTIDRFASGSGLNNGNPDNNQTAWSKLTFANKSETGEDMFGKYTAAGSFPSAPTIASFFGTGHTQQPIGAGSVDVGSLAFTTGQPVQVRTANDLTITGSNLPAGKSVVILASGTVSIDGDINYTDGALGGVGDIPQVVIIANNINIKDSVGRIDAWLVASGTINTCSNLAGVLTSNKCATPLVVNGPVVTNKIILNRTAGSDTGEHSGDPAETFNLRPDAFLWARLQASGNNKAETVYSQELPPRF